jgi:hypothetical protein
MTPGAKKATPAMAAVPWAFSSHATSLPFAKALAETAPEWPSASAAKLLSERTSNRRFLTGTEQETGIAVTRCKQKVRQFLTGTDSRFFSGRRCTLFASFAAGSTLPGRSFAFQNHAVNFFAHTVAPHV